MGNQKKHRQRKRKRRNKRSRLATPPTNSPEPVALSSTSSDGDVGSSIEASSPQQEVGEVRHDYEAKRKRRRRKKKKAPTTCSDEANGDDFLCTTFCDLLCDLPTPRSWKLAGTGALFIKMSAALQKCSIKGIRENNTEDIDLRGLVADEAKRFLITALNSWDHHPTAKFLNVRVGCKEHGVGKGKLRDMLCDLLERDPEPNKIVWNLKSEDSIISIKLDGRVDYSSLWKSSRSRPCSDPEPSQEVPLHEVCESSKNGFLCSIVSDFLFSLPMPSRECWKEGTTLKILAGLRKCDQGVSEKDIDGSYTMDLRGLCTDEVKERLIETLNCRPDLQYLRVRVGCKVHGFGEGKLRNFVIDMLKRDQKIESKFEGDGSVISIKLDGREDYSSLGSDLSEHSDEHVSSPVLNFSCHSPPRDDGVAYFSSNDEADLTTRSDVKEKVMPHIISSVSSEKVFLCTFICDFLCDLPIPLGEEITLKVLAGFEKCNPGISVKDTDGSYSIDIRGRYIEDAKKILMDHLNCHSDLKYLNVIVGCKKHGVGSGKLKDWIHGWLECDLEIECVFVKKCIIRVKLDSVPLQVKMSGRKKSHIVFSYPSVTSSSLVSGGGSSVAGGTAQSEGVAAVNDFSQESLCTTFCDLLIDIPKPAPLDVSRVFRKASAGLDEWCNKVNRGKSTKATKVIDLRGLLGDGAKGFLITTLNCWARTMAKFLNVRVGCKEHGVGKGNLRDMLCYLLDSNPKKIIWNLRNEGSVRGSIISIKLDGRDDYSPPGYGLNRVVSCGALSGTVREIGQKAMLLYGKRKNEEETEKEKYGQPLGLFVTAQPSTKPTAQPSTKPAVMHRVY